MLGRTILAAFAAVAKIEPLHILRDNHRPAPASNLRITPIAQIASFSRTEKHAEASPNCVSPKTSEVIPKAGNGDYQLENSDPSTNSRSR